MIMIETPLSVLNIQEICAASPKVEVVVVGSNKLANRLQIDIKKRFKSYCYIFSSNCTCSKSLWKNCNRWSTF